MWKLIYAVTFLAFPALAEAQETTTYSYDTLGRLTGSTVNKAQDAVQTVIDYDPAGNRRKYKVTGAAAASGDTDAGSSTPTAQRFVVVPLNGFTIIPIG